MLGEGDEVLRKTHFVAVVNGGAWALLGTLVGEIPVAKRISLQFASGGCVSKLANVLSNFDDLGHLALLGCDFCETLSNETPVSKSALCIVKNRVFAHIRIVMWMCEKTLFFTIQNTSFDTCVSFDRVSQKSKPSNARNTIYD